MGRQTGLIYLSLRLRSAFRDESHGKDDCRNRQPAAQDGKGQDYVRTHGFSEIMCLHLWGRIDWQRCDAGCRCTASACLQGCQEKAEGAQNCLQSASAQSETRAQSCSDDHDADFDLYANGVIREPGYGPDAVYAACNRYAI
jgi:hypothetical protein